jgi:hypothetical protein
VPVAGGAIGDLQSRDTTDLPAAASFASGKCKAHGRENSVLPLREPIRGFAAACAANSSAQALTLAQADIEWMRKQYVLLANGRSRKLDADAISGIAKTKIRKVGESVGVAAWQPVLKPVLAPALWGIGAG